MIQLSLESSEGCYDELFFRNGSPAPAGDLLGAGVSLPLRNHGWWNMGELWSYPYYTLGLMLEGGSGFYRDESGYECQLSYGDGLLTTPNFPHLCGPGKNEQWSNIYVAFAGEVFDVYLRAGILHPEKAAFKLPNPGLCIEELQRLVTQPRPTDSLAVARHTHTFLGYLLGILSESTPLAGSNQTSDWFDQACALLTRDLHHKINLQNVADELGMSYHTFRLYFTRRGGISPRSYRDTQRLNAACDLLINNPQKNYQQIAFILGYYNGDHFSRQFKQQMGMSPKAYQEKYLGK